MAMLAFELFGLLSCCRVPSKNSMAGCGKHAIYALCQPIPLAIHAVDMRLQVIQLC